MLPMADRSTPQSTPSVVAPTIGLDDKGCVAEHVRCGKCGYDVFGLDVEGLCPECGTRLCVSLGNSRLLFADPAWIAKVASGVEVLFLCGTASFVVLMISVVLFLKGEGIFAAGAAFIALLGGIACGVGVWYLTTSEPNGKETTRRAVLWLGLRLGSVFAALGLAFFVSGPAIGVAAILTSLYVVLVFVWPYLRMLLGRLPERKLMRGCHIMTAASAILPPACLFVAVGTAHLPHMGSLLSDECGQASGAILAVFVLAAAVKGVLVLKRSSEALRKIADDARKLRESRPELFAAERGNR